MNLNFFEFDSRSGELVINEPQVFTIPQFKALMDSDRNKSKEDKKGVLKLRARKELSYLYLTMHKKSPYFQYPEQEAHTTALEDAGLTQEEFDDPIFREACKKYQEIMKSDRLLKLIRTAFNKVDDINDYFEHIVDFDERDNSMKPIFKVKDVIAEMTKVGELIEGLKSLELLYCKGNEEVSDLRSDATPGFMD